MIIYTSRSFRGVRDWSVKAKRTDDTIVVTVKVGRMLHSRVRLSLTAWPKNLYDQRQVATKALGEAIGVSVEDWDSPELDRIPDEIVKAVAGVTNAKRPS